MNPIQQFSTVLAEKIPALVVYKHDIFEAARKGTVIMYHGLSSAKESGQKELLILANAGYLAIAVDNVGHGARSTEEWNQAFSGNHRLEAMIEAVYQSVEEIPAMIQDLQSKGAALEGKIAITGISMGGYIAFASSLKDKRITACCPILGSPVWNRTHPYSPHRWPQYFPPSALLIQNASLDQAVPAKFAREFHQTLIPVYKDNPHKLCYIEFSESGHTMLEKDWNQVWENILVWLGRHLH